jgi:ABC-type branched-subunit amino acid transport system substrate-binding protein
MKFIFRAVFLVMVLLLSNILTAQNNPIRVAIFSPIYMDSAFIGDTYKLGDGNLPKQMLPGLEFYNGAMAAIDSLEKQGMNAEVMVYDTKSSNHSLHNILQQLEENPVDLMITSCNDRNELMQMAQFALQKHIPLISATYPNNAGIYNNPYFIILNSTLQTHCSSIYKYLQRNNAFDKIVLFTRKGKPAEIIQGIFSQMSHNTYSVPLKYLTVQLPDTFTVNQVKPYLDSTKKNIIICGSLNDMFALQLIKAAGDAKNYDIEVMGMPTWDAMQGLDQLAYASTTIVYTTPFYYNRTSQLYNNIAQQYRTQLNANPTDMMLKGYETTFHFLQLWQQFGPEAIHHLSENKFVLFNKYNIQPVRDNKDLSAIHYLENQQLYFVKKQGGAIKSVN